MTNRDYDLDQIVDYKAEYSAYIKKATISGKQMSGICPFHDDKTASFSANLETGQWHCFAEDRSGNILSFLSEIEGITTKEVYVQLLNKYGINTDNNGQAVRQTAHRPMLLPPGQTVNPEPEQTMDSVPDQTENPAPSQTENPAPGQTENQEGEATPAQNAEQDNSYTLEEYAKDKHLPVEWLVKYFRLRTYRNKRGIASLSIPYIDENGLDYTYRIRKANRNFLWKKGSAGKIGLYGVWYISAIRKMGFVILVEGESDTHSLWFMKFPVLGVPGASMFKVEHVEYLKGLKLFIHVEDDKGGRAFINKVLTDLKKGEFSGSISLFSCSQIQVKDPSDVLIKYGPREGAEKIKALLETAKPIDLTPPEEIPVAIPDAPINLRQPAPWVISDDGIFRIDYAAMTETLVCRTPIILARRLKALDTGAEKIEIAFKRDGKWHHSVHARSVLFNRQSITALADQGCTISSENAKSVVQYLVALEAENMDLLPVTDSTSTYGWQPGNRFIPGVEDNIMIDIPPSQISQALAYSKKGTLQGWIDTMTEHRARDRFRFLLAASFAAPLLRIINQRIFFVYVWGDSKSGKTAGLKAALSAWGDPNKLMVNFNATQVGLERTAAFYCDLPLGIDERQLAGRSQESLEKIVYMIAAGTGKIRGAKAGGLQAIHTWRTVAIATGEEPLSTDTSQTGVSTRVLELYGGPFENEKAASAMHQESTVDYGWAGPEFVRLIASTNESSICAKYEEMLDYVQSVSDGKSGSHVAGVAAVALADAIIDDMFFAQSGSMALSDKTLKMELVISTLAWERAKLMAKNIIQAQISAAVADVNVNATQFVADWVLSNKMYFDDRTPGTRLGFYAGNDDVVYVFPSLLKQALEREGYSSQKTLRYMAESGYISTSNRSDHKGQNYTVTKRYKGKTCRVIELFLARVLDESENEITPAAETPVSKTEAADVGGKIVQPSVPPASEPDTDDGFQPFPSDIDLPFD